MARPHPYARARVAYLQEEAARLAVVIHRLATTEHVCPDCRVERADYAGPLGAYLPQCPNCTSVADPVPYIRRRSA